VSATLFLVRQISQMGGAAMAVLARRIVNACSVIEFIDAIVTYPDHLSNVLQLACEPVVTPNHTGFI